MPVLIEGRELVEVLAGMIRFAEESVEWAEGQWRMVLELEEIASTDALHENDAVHPVSPAWLRVDEVGFGLGRAQLTRRLELLTQLAAARCDVLDSMAAYAYDIAEDEESLSGFYCLISACQRDCADLRERGYKVLKALDLVSVYLPPPLKPSPAKVDEVDEASSSEPPPHLRPVS